MLTNSWSIALLLCMAATLFLVLLAGATAARILLFWDADSDSERQIDLEGRTWLAAALVQTGLAVQMFSLLLLVLAADAFSTMIAGAMCATGSFLANDYGSWSLFWKIAGIFLYGFWIVLHRLDLCSEYSPLIRVKFTYLFFLIPVLFFDSYYLFQYLLRLEPDIITSCCGVIFSTAVLQENFFMLSVSAENLVAFFYLLAGVLVLFGWRLGRTHLVDRFTAALYILYGALFLVFFILSLVVITVFFSSYIYAMPSHNCPFDILRGDYGYIGYPLYIFLFGASFAGMSSGAAAPFYSKAGLKQPLNSFGKYAVKTATILLLLFVTLVSYPLLRYFFAGGEF
jgi:hypothetical protein